MPEHFIRLRGGWEWEGLDVPNSRLCRVTLPMTSRDDRAGRIRLSRRFGRPPIDGASETLWLRLDRVPGLESVTLNGSDIALGPAWRGPLEIALGELPERNLLVLELSLPAPDSDQQGLASPWGEIVLVVRSGARR